MLKKHKSVRALAVLLIALCTISLLSSARVSAATSFTDLGGYQIQVISSDYAPAVSWQVDNFKNTLDIVEGAALSTDPQTDTINLDHDSERDGTYHLFYCTTGQSQSECAGNTVGTHTFIIVGGDLVRYYEGLTDSGFYNLPPDWLVNQDIGTSSSYISATVGTATLPVATKFLTFLNVPYLLSTRIPFGYLYEAKDDLLSAFSTTSTRASPSIGLSFKLSPNVVTTTVVLFSTTTIRMFMTSDSIANLRGILVIILYAEFIYFMYHLIRKISL